jgi:16S rRNA (guanine(1405)-N(7))-methyltransferase
MTLSQPDSLREVLALLQRSSRYNRIYPALVQRLAIQELQKRKNTREAARHTRTRLYQIGGAFISEAVDFQSWQDELSGITSRKNMTPLVEFCRRMMNSHVSTRERLPFLEDFYARIFEDAGDIHSLLDLGCGLNPLCIPWIPLDPITVVIFSLICLNSTSFFSITTNFLAEYGPVI